MGVLVGAAQQHAEIPVGGGPLPLLVRNGEAALHQLADAPGNPGALGLLGGGAPLAGDELQLGLAALLGGVVRPAHQALLPGVVHVPGRLGHQPGEDEVHRVRHLFARAEVPIQSDGGGVAVPLPVVLGEGPAGPQENFRHGPAEAVDALLYVPHHEQVLPVLGHRPEQGVLHLVDVLVLVYHDFVKAGGHLPGGGGGLAVLPQKQADGLVLQVAVIQEVPLPLFLGVPPGKVQGELLQAFHQGGGLGDFPHAGGPVRRQVLQQLPGGPLHLFAEGLQPVLEGVAVVAPQRPPPGRGEVPRRLGKAVPVPGPGQLLQAEEGLAVLLQGGGVGLLHGGVLPALLQSPGQQPQAVGGRLPGVVQNHPLPGGGPRPSGHAGEVHLHLFRKPPLREGVALHKAVQGQHHLQQAAVVPLPGEGVRQGAHGALLKGLGQGLVEGGVHQVFLLLVRDDFKIRRKVQQVEELPHHLGAEAVHRADVRLGQQHALPPQVGVAGVLPEHLVQAGLQPGAHLRRRGLCKGDDEHPVGAGGVLRVGQPLDGPLHQHRRFARAGRGRHQHGAPPGGDGVLLAVCPTHISHGGSLLSPAFPAFSPRPAGGWSCPAPRPWR